MADFFHQNLSYFLSGISVGGQYALIAIGYTMVYGILRLINFAHGDVFMCAGLMMVYFSSSMPFVLSIPAVLILTVLLGFVIERVAYKPLRSAPRMSVMISAIGVSYLLQNAARREPSMNVIEITRLIFIPISWLVSKSLETALIAIPIFVCLISNVRRTTRITVKTGVMSVTTLVEAPQICTDLERTGISG